MFGYIRIDKDGLSEKEYERYRSVYCSLCRQLSRDYSFASRLILSYDCTFLSLLILSLSEECPAFQKGRCPVNPTKKCSYCIKDEKALSFSAALSVSSAYFKLIDDIKDSPLYKKIFCYLLKPFLSHWRKKAKKKFPDVDRAVEEMMKKQEKAEDNFSCTIDEAADPTASMLSEIFSLIPDYFSLKQRCSLEKQKRILSSFGYFLGRWIYLMDAADDFDKDKKSGSFNPFILRGFDEKDIIEQILPVLNHSLSEALLSYGLLNPGRYDTIISNILYSACMKVQRSTLSQYEKQISGEENE